MKIALLTIVCLCSVSLFAQNSSADKVVQKFLVQFNHSNYDDIYESFSSEYKQTVSKETASNYLTNIHRMIDGFKSSKFISADGRTLSYFFVCKDKLVNADFQCILNDDGKFEYLSFKRIGGTGSAPTVEKIKQ